MSGLDVLRIEKSVAKVMMESVGNQLATVPSTPDPLPAVVLERIFQKDGTQRNPSLPDYPWCSISYNRIVDEIELTNEFIRDDEKVYQTNKIVSVSIKFHGNRLHSVDSISNRAHMSLESEYFRTMLRTLYGDDITLRNKSDIVPVNTNLQDKYLEVRSFDIFLSVVDEYSLPLDFEGHFNRIQLDTEIPVEGVDGGIYHQEDDTSPLHVEIDTNK